VVLDDLSQLVQAAIRALSQTTCVRVANIPNRLVIGRRDRLTERVQQLDLGLSQRVAGVSAVNETVSDVGVSKLLHKVVDLQCLP